MAIREALQAGLTGVRGKRNGPALPAITSDKSSAYRGMLQQSNEIGIVEIVDDAVLLKVLYHMRRFFPGKQLSLLSDKNESKLRKGCSLPVDAYTRVPEMNDVVVPLQHVLWAKVPGIDKENKIYWLADTYGNLLPFDLRSRVIRLIYKVGAVILYPLLVSFISIMLARGTRGCGR